MVDIDEKAQILRMNQIMGLSDEAEFEDGPGTVRDKNTGRLIGGDNDANDTLLNVAFDVESILDKGATFDKGHRVYVDVVYITITPPGKVGQTLKVRSPVTEYYKWRFPVDYKKYTEGREQRVSGTPLTALIDMPPSRVKELEGNNVFTLEQLVGLSVNEGQFITNLAALQKQAKLYLESAKAEDSNAVMQIELEKRDQQLSFIANQMVIMEQRLKEAEKAATEAEAKAAAAEASEVEDEAETVVAAVRKTYKKAE